MADSNQPDMQTLWSDSSLYGESAPWLEMQYETYLSQPDKLDTQWRAYFDALPVHAEKDSINGDALNDNGQNGHTSNRNAQVNRPEVSPAQIHDFFVQYARKKNNVCYSDNSGIEHERKQVQVLQLINAYRFRGHQVADVNPLGGRRAGNIPELSLDYHGLTENDFDLNFDTGSLAGVETLSLRDIVNVLHESYCGSIGVEYMHITETSEKRWLQQHLETQRGMANLNDVEKINILLHLTDE